MEGYKTLQSALPARGNNGGKDKVRGPPKRPRALILCGRQGGEEGGTPHPAARAHGAHRGIMRRMDLWEKCLHAGLEEDAQVEGAAREVR